MVYQGFFLLGIYLFCKNIHRVQLLIPGFPIQLRLFQPCPARLCPILLWGHLRHRQIVQLQRQEWPTSGKPRAKYLRKVTTQLRTRYHHTYLDAALQPSVGPPIHKYGFFLFSSANFAFELVYTHFLSKRTFSLNSKKKPANQYFCRAQEGTYYLQVCLMPKVRGSEMLVLAH